MDEEEVKKPQHVILVAIYNAPLRRKNEHNRKKGAENIFTHNFQLFSFVFFFTNSEHFSKPFMPNKYLVSNIQYNKSLELPILYIPSEIYVESEDLCPSIRKSCE